MIQGVCVSLVCGTMCITACPRYHSNIVAPVCDTVHVCGIAYTYSSTCV